MNKVVCWLHWNIDPTSTLNCQSDSPQALQALDTYGAPDRVIVDYPGEKWQEKGEPTVNSGYRFTEHVGYKRD